MTPASTASARVAAPPNSREPSPEQLQSVRLTLRSPGRLKTEVLAGLVVALALIPEAISFSIIAGVDPQVGLFASFTMAVTVAILGGRPAMISAATGAMALVMVDLVRQHGLDYLLAATLLTGLLQIVAGYLRLGDLMRFVSGSVVTGFVNALGILIFMQWPSSSIWVIGLFIGIDLIFEGWAMIMAGMAIHSLARPRREDLGHAGPAGV